MSSRSARAAGLVVLALAGACSDEPLSSVSAAASSSGTAGSGGAAGEGGAGAAGGIGGDGGVVLPDPALIEVSMESRVAVLLDEVPPSIRERVADFYLAQPAEFWEARAARQIARSGEYAWFDRNQLPLPPRSTWKITLDPAGAARGVEDAHDVVVISYAFSAAIVTDGLSPLAHDKALAEPGDSDSYSFQLPVDPDLLYQRIADDCSEGGFPLPYPACADTVAAVVGIASGVMEYERVTWDEARVAEVRVDEPTFEQGADLEVVAAGLEAARVVYRWFEPDDCALVESCVGGPGWRRLLQFTASVHNRGGKAMHLGKVEGSALEAHNVFSYSACHEHDHFLQYGEYSLGPILGDKRAFCLVSTSRYSNNEWTPLVTPYDASCTIQGIAAGWGDDYAIGLDCQWIDVTDIDLSSGPVEMPLTFQSNPEKFLCEGVPVIDDSGQLEFEPTPFVNENGDPIDRPKCDFFEGWDGNNEKTHLVSLSPEGTHVTEPCPFDLLGPKRDCDFTEQEDGLGCVPGATVQLSCAIADPAYPQTIRVCEASAALGTALACGYTEAAANVVVETGSSVVTFTCPEPRGAAEPGGVYGLFTAPLFAADPLQTVTCVSM